MKLIGLIMTVLILLAGLSVPASAASNTVYVDPMALAAGIINLDYEKTISDNITLNTGFYSINVADRVCQISGYSLKAGSRYYFQEAQQGSYCGLRLGYTDFSVTGYGVSVTGEGIATNGIFLIGARDGESFTLAINLGNKWLFGSGYIIDSGFSTGYSSRDNFTAGIYCNASKKWLFDSGCVIDFGLSTNYSNQGNFTLGIHYNIGYNW